MARVGWALGPAVVVGAEWKSHPKPLTTAGPSTVCLARRERIERLQIGSFSLHASCREEFETSAAMQSTMFDGLVIANHFGCLGARVMVSEWTWSLLITTERQAIEITMIVNMRSAKKRQ
jgi:hypothetical protein